MWPMAASDVAVCKKVQQFNSNIARAAMNGWTEQQPNGLVDAVSGDDAQHMPLALRAQCPL